MALADMHLDAVAAHDQAGIADARLAQHAAHVVAQVLQHFLAHGLGIDLEQEVRAALQVEAEHDVALRPGPASCRPWLLGRKLGTANSTTTSTVPRIATTLQRVK